MVSVPEGGQLDLLVEHRKLKLNPVLKTWS